ncbi:MAG: cob(I)yrinic acid a,c-diamide adenosyltransferase [Chitinophagia bacterium]|nr:cob(I)yrinic acid a,c-diamide adenosyltransferase [Chitinophagia bacterium]
MFKIYTKTGDKGGTSLIGGVRVPKSHIRIDSYGTVDELNSYLGVVSDSARNGEITAQLSEIQDRLFTIGSALATDPRKEIKMKLPDLFEADIQWLELQIDAMNEHLPEMRSFILPGGHIASSTCHVARCVCRRAERICVAMQESGEWLPPLVIPYLNRLSDYLFVLARYISHINGIADKPWNARLEGKE